MSLKQQELAAIFIRETGTKPGKMRKTSSTYKVQAR
jgi:hypothetical protein